MHEHDKAQQPLRGTSCAVFRSKVGLEARIRDLPVGPDHSSQRHDTEVTAKQQGKPLFLPKYSTVWRSPYCATLSYLDTHTLPTRCICSSSIVLCKEDVDICIAKVKRAASVCCTFRSLMENLHGKTSESQCPRCRKRTAMARSALCIAALALALTVSFQEGKHRF